MSRVIRTIEDYKKHPDYNKCLDKWSEKFMNMIKHVINNKELSERFGGSFFFSNLTKNPNISWNTINNNPDIPWSHSEYNINPNITWEIVRENPNYDWDYCNLPENPNITWEIVRDNPYPDPTNPEKIRGVILLLVVTQI